MSEKEIDFLSELNDAQRAAVTHTNGPVMIIAGAGSGKTRVLTYRIAYLMTQGVDAFNIIALTFTNKASREMRERISRLVGNEAKNLWMGTFHSIFSRILRIEHDRIGYPQNFTIYDSEDSKSLIKSIVKEMQLDDKIYKPGLVLNRISMAKNQMISARAYAENTDLVNYDRQTNRGKMSDIYFAYTERCFKSGAMDFDDILLKTYELFYKHTDTLNKYQHKFRYALVDEFQDTNVLQYNIIKLLAAVHENICVVGDDAQSIYAFRGATIDNILNFEKDYPDLKVYKLEQNYRSTRTIVDAAGHIISKNKKQLEKNVWTENEPGEKIQLMRAATDNEEGNKVAEVIFEERMRNHRMNSAFAILYRTNAQSRAFEEALRKRNIPYRIYGGLSFYQRKEIKDIIAYFRMAINPADEEALKRIINYPARGIGKTTIDRLIIQAAAANSSLWDVVQNVQAFPELKSAANALGVFRDMIKGFGIMAQGKNAFETAEHILKHSGLIKELNEDKTVEGISRIENINELMNGIKSFVEDDTAENEKTLAEYIKDIALLTDADEKENDDNDKVKLMTIHAAKGLEFPVVFVVGLEENLFPSQLSLNSRTELEEERRLFYVGVTRAEEKLNLSFATSRFKYGNIQFSEPSRFLYEIDPSLYHMDIRMLTATALNNPAAKVPGQSAVSTSKPLTSVTSRIVPKTPASNYVADSDFVPDDTSALAPGMKVIHQRFGPGEVIHLEGSGDNRKATVKFADVGDKQLVLKFAKIKIVS